MSSPDDTLEFHGHQHHYPSQFAPHFDQYPNVYMIVDSNQVYAYLGNSAVNPHLQWRHGQQVHGSWGASYHQTVEHDSDRKEREIVKQKLKEHQAKEQEYRDIHPKLAVFLPERKRLFRLLEKVRHVYGYPKAALECHGGVAFEAYQMKALGINGGVDLSRGDLDIRINLNLDKETEERSGAEITRVIYAIAKEMGMSGQFHGNNNNSGISFEVKPKKGEKYDAAVVKHGNSVVFVHEKITLNLETLEFKADDFDGRPVTELELTSKAAKDYAALALQPINIGDGGLKDDDAPGRPTKLKWAHILKKIYKFTETKTKSNFYAKLYSLKPGDQLNHTLELLNVPRCTIFAKRIREMLQEIYINKFPHLATWLDTVKLGTTGKTLNELAATYHDRLGCTQGWTPSSVTGSSPRSSMSFSSETTSSSASSTSSSTVAMSLPASDPASDPEQAPTTSTGKTTTSAEQSAETMQPPPSPDSAVESASASSSSSAATTTATSTVAKENAWTVVEPRYRRPDTGSMQPETPTASAPAEGKKKKTKKRRKKKTPPDGNLASNAVPSVDASTPSRTAQTAKTDTSKTKASKYASSRESSACSRFCGYAYSLASGVGNAMCSVGESIGIYSSKQTAKKERRKLKQN